MTTSTNVVGGGDNANPNQLNGQNPEQSVNSGPQAVDSTTPNNYGVPGLTKFFAKYPALTDLHKKMLAALYAEGESMATVKKAARSLLGAEVYDMNANSSDMPNFSELQEAYNLEESDVQMLEDLFESGYGAEVIVSKAKRLANLAEVYDAPFAKNFPHVSDEEFINSLKVGLDLTPDDLLTVVGMVQKRVPRDLVERTANRLKQYPAIANIVNQVLDLKADTTTAPAAKSKAVADTSFALEISANGRTRWSQAQVLTFALTQYIESRHKELLAFLSAEDFGDAMTAQHDIDAAREILCSLTIGLAGLANNNYWANKGESTEGDKAGEFKSFAKHKLKWTPTEIDLYVKENY